MVQQQTTIQCPNCGQIYEAPVTPVIDANQNPDAKMRLLGGQINVAPCPNCGTPNAIATPLVYHDASKELFITFIPPEINLPKDQQEKLLGDLTRQVMSQIPQENVKAYLFQPRQALTLQGLIDQVLEADGVTREMMDEQRAKTRLVETFLQTPEDELENLVRQHDDKIDVQFFQLISMIAQRFVQQGQPELAQQAINVQQRLVELSTAGQEMMQQSEMQDRVVQEVADAVRALGQDADRNDVVELVVRFADSDEHLQALVGLIRPAFDYMTLQELTTRISQAPAADRDRLEHARDRIHELTAMIDQQQQMAVQQAAQALQALINAPDTDAAIQEMLPMVDDTFMAVLSANIQEAERRSDVAASAKLKDVYNRLVTALRDNMQPELRFINELLSVESDEEARQMIGQQATDYGPVLLEMVDAVRDVVAAQGDNAIMERLAFVRREIEQQLS